MMSRVHHLGLAAFLIVIAPFAWGQTKAGADTWPLRFTVGADKVQIFAPQPERINGDHFDARFAVSVKRPQDASPVFGAVWGTGVLAIDRTTRLGQITRFTVTDARFPGMDDPGEQARISTLIGTALPEQAPPIPIDWLVAALENEQEGVVTYANDPPEIIYSERPGVLVFIDGEPLYGAVGTKDDRYDDPLYPPAKRVERVVNTPFLMLRPEGREHYLYGSGMWFTSRTIEGPWVRSFSVSKELRDIAQRVDSTAALESANADGSTVVPEIVMRTRPAVLLDFNGAPQFQPLPGTALLHATNTEDDLFLDVASQDHYLLTSGRWFATRDLRTGPWRFVPADKLPAEFARIPEGSAKDGALAHIAGTRAAQEAARDASVPQTAQVDRRTATLTVVWDGDPQFERIAGTEVESAINASVTLLRINGRYHALDKAVWFEGPTPDGPWTVSTAVPPEVNTIPPSSPVYNTRYVYIYDHTPEVVYVGYTPGYLGSYVQGGVVIYGTGYYYDPWPGPWRPRPFTWGFGVYYDPWVGWSYGLGWGWNWYYPGWYGWGWGYSYPWCWGWWGPWGYHPPVVYHHHHHYHYGPRPSLSSDPRTDVRSTTTEHVRSTGTNLYLQRDAQGVKPASVTRTMAHAGTDAKPARTTSKPGANDHFTDGAGNVYRRNNDRLERLDQDRWVPVKDVPSLAPSRDVTRPPTAPADPPVRIPERDLPADPRSILQDRSRGQQRVNNFNRSIQQRTAPASPSRSPSPAPRPSPTPKAPGRTPAPR